MLCIASSLLLTLSLFTHTIHVIINTIQGIGARVKAVKVKKVDKSSKSSKEKKTKKKEKKTKSSSSVQESVPAADEYNYGSDNTNDNDNHESTTTSECSDTVLAIAPNTYCNDWIPGIGRKECVNDDSSMRGGEVCNIVSMAWLRALKQDDIHVDLVLNHAGLCRDVIEQDAVTKSDIQDVLPEGFGIVLVHMTGKDIKKALQQGAKAAYYGNPKAYPYGYGIRYSVDYKSRTVDDGFVYNIQVKPGGVGGADAWVEIDDLKTYYVATSSNLANGKDGYSVFLDVIEVDKTALVYSDADLFIKYAKQKCELDGAPYSTYNFKGLSALLSESWYSCLEEEGLCDCGFCKSE